MRKSSKFSGKMMFQMVSVAISSLLITLIFMLSILALIVMLNDWEIEVPDFAQWLKFDLQPPQQHTQLVVFSEPQLIIEPFEQLFKRFVKLFAQQLIQQWKLFVQQRKLFVQQFTQQW